MASWPQTRSDTLLDRSLARAIRHHRRLCRRWQALALPDIVQGNDTVNAASDVAAAVSDDLAQRAIILWQQVHELRPWQYLPADAATPITGERLRTMQQQLGVVGYLEQGSDLRLLRIFFINELERLLIETVQIHRALGCAVIATEQHKDEVLSQQHIDALVWMLEITHPFLPEQTPRFDPRDFSIPQTIFSILPRLLHLQVQRTETTARGLIGRMQAREHFAEQRDLLHSAGFANADALLYRLAHGRTTRCCKIASAHCLRCPYHVGWRFQSAPLR